MPRRARRARLAALAPLNRPPARPHARPSARQLARPPPPALPLPLRREGGSAVCPLPTVFTVAPPREPFVRGRRRGRRRAEKGAVSALRLLLCGCPSRVRVRAISNIVRVQV